MYDETNHPPVPMSQSHIANEFAKNVTGSWCYVHDYKRWFYFDGDVWQMDSMCKIKRVVETFCNAATYWHEAAKLSDSEKRGMTFYRYLGNILDMAKCHPLVARLAEEINLPPKKRNHRGRYPCP